MGLAKQDGVEESTDVTGVTARVTASSTAGTITVAVTVGAGDATARLPWSGGNVRLEAARFLQADFLVVQYVAGPTGGTYEWTHAVFDLRATAATSTAPNPIVLGPQDLPAGVSDLSFCPDPSGRLVLVWSGYPASATGRIAAVYRTDKNALSRSEALVGIDSPNATGVIACKVTTTPAPGMLDLYDHALKQAAGVALPNPPPTPIASQPAPRPGQLRLSPRTLDLPATQTTATFLVENQGQEVLEVTGITWTGGNQIITVVPSVQLPFCLGPGHSFTVAVSRRTNNAATSTITVSTAPAAAAGSNTVVVTLEKLVPDPRATVTPLLHTWKKGQTDTRSVVVKNVGNVPLVIGFGALSPPFTLAAAQTTLVPGASVTARVTPPSTCTGAELDASFNVAAALSPVTTTMPQNIAGFPVKVQLQACVPLTTKVPKGSLRITTIEYDAPGDDVKPEGEFIEILNVTSAPLDLAGCSVWDRTISASGVPGGFRKFFEFGPTVFETDAKLPPGQTVRLLTRVKVPSDAGRSRFDIFGNFKIAVWNNSGDSGRIVDENGDVVAEYTYVTSQPAGGAPLPPGTVVSPPRRKNRYLARPVYVDVQTDWTYVFPVQDGDLVTFATAGTARFGLLGGQVGPNGAPGPLTPAGQGWPLEGAPPFALIGSLEGGPPFLVGSMASITFNRNSRPLMLTLGPNDGELWDNAGVWVCDVALYR